MACYRCGTRQVDPARGHSPWQRGVRSDQQVLICPTCQGIHDWKADLDQCGRCGSVRLVRRLGETECRECGFVAAPEAAAPEAAATPEVVLTPGGAVAEVAAMPGMALASGGMAAMTGAGAGIGLDADVPGPSGAGAPSLSGADAPGLSEEVERALDRVLGRGPVRG